MTFAQRKLLVLAAWIAAVATIGIILTIDKPDLWMSVAGLALIPAAMGNWFWDAPEVRLSQLIAKARSDALSAAIAMPASAGVEQMSLVPAISADGDSEDARWRHWRTNGRDEDARFRQRLRTVLIDAAGIAALGAALWLTFRN